MSDTGYGDFEFERKFFVRELPSALLDEPAPDVIVQSYYLAADGYALRVRLQGPAPADLPVGGAEEVLDAVAGAFTFCALTAKGPYVGGTRYEAERELDTTVGLEMVRRGGTKVLKYRHSIWLGADGWVIDQFLDANAPLVMAECERGGPVTDLAIPAFCVTEVTDDPRFSNDFLAGSPYRGWQGEFEAELAGRGPHFLQEFGHNELGTELGSASEL
ncbi:MAG: CYTH domain-containing protein [Georgenia sp.]